MMLQEESPTAVTTLNPAVRERELPPSPPGWTVSIAGPADHSGHNTDPPGSSPSRPVLPTGPFNEVEETFDVVCARRHFSRPVNENLQVPSLRVK